MRATFLRRAPGPRWSRSCIRAWRDGGSDRKRVQFVVVEIVCLSRGKDATAHIDQGPDQRRTGRYGRRRRVVIADERAGATWRIEIVDPLGYELFFHRDRRTWKRRLHSLGRRGFLSHPRLPRLALVAPLCRKGRLFKLADFIGQERTILSGGQISQPQWADRDSLQSQYLVAHARQKPANLAIAPFVEHDFQDGALLVMAFDADPLGMGIAFGQMNAVFELRQGLAAGHSDHLGLIRLFDLVSRVCQQIGQFAVVSDQNQPLARNIQSSDWKQPLMALDQVGNTRSTGGIAGGRDHAHRFMEHEILAFRPRKRLAIDADLLQNRIDARAEFFDDAAVDLDSSLGDQLLGLATAAETGRCKDFLQPRTRIGVVGKRSCFALAAEAALAGRRRSRFSRSRFRLSPGHGKWLHGRLDLAIIRIWRSINEGLVYLRHNAAGIMMPPALEFSLDIF